MLKNENIAAAFQLYFIQKHLHEKENAKVNEKAASLSFVKNVNYGMIFNDERRSEYFNSDV